MATTTTTSDSPAPSLNGILLQPTEQDSNRQLKAKELLRDLSALVTEGQPGIELITEALLKAEELTQQAANNKKMDSDTRKTLDDISTLLVTVREFGENKQIVDQLYNIKDESAKALKVVNKGSDSIEATEEIKEYMTNWRALFYLITSSRDFRQLLLDSIKIAKRIVGVFSDSRSEIFDEGVPVGKMYVRTKKVKRAKKGRKISTEKREDEKHLTIENDKEVTIENEKQVIIEKEKQLTIDNEDVKLSVRINIHDEGDTTIEENGVQSKETKKVRNRSSRGKSPKDRSPKNRSPRSPKDRSPRTPKDRSPRSPKDKSPKRTSKRTPKKNSKSPRKSPKEKSPRKILPELSEQEWDRVQDDIQKILVALTKEPSFEEGITRIFYLLDQYKKNIEEEPVQAAIVFANVAAETEAFVSLFSGREALENFKRHLRNLILQIQLKEEMQNYFLELQSFILKNRSEEEIRSAEFKAYTRELAFRGRELMQELSQEDDLKLFLEASDDMVHNIKNDELIQILRQNAGIVQEDLSYVDTDGKVRVDTDMLFKLQAAFLPVLADALKFLPVPKIYSNDDEREFSLDNIVLCSYDMLPEQIRFHIQSDSEISVRDIELTSHTYLVIELDKLLTELKDIEFLYRKKTFPHFEENGKVTFRIKGQGAKLTFTYTIDQEPQDIIPRIKEGHASFDISDIAFDFDKSTLKHDTMVPMLTHFFKTQIRHQIEKEVEKNLTGFLEKLGSLMTKSLIDSNKSFFTKIQSAKNAMKSTEIASVYDKRRELLE